MNKRSLTSYAALAVMLFAFAGSASAATVSENYESSAPGKVSGVNPSYDVEIVDASGFGSGQTGQALRISNAVTSGSFGDWVFTPSVSEEAGEASAETSALSSGTRQTHYEVSFDIASASSTSQTGLQVSVSPDRGDGARMSYLRFVDQADGIHVMFNDYANHDFREVDVASLSLGATHNIKLAIDFVDGEKNDIVRVYADNQLKATGTSWEEYFRDGSESTKTVDSLLIQARDGKGTAPETLGKGFLFDNITVTTSASVVPSDVYVKDTYNGSAGTSQDGHVMGDDAFSTLPAAIDRVAAGGTVHLLSNASTSAAVVVNKSVIIDGGNFTLSPEFTKTDNSNNAGIIVLHSDVAIKNLVIDGAAGVNLHGIHVYTSTGVMLDGVTVKNNDKAGIVVNGSAVTVNNINTSGNTWGGINVDQGSGVTTPAALTVNGTSVHAETGPAIWIDDTTKAVTVTDTNTQYSFTDTDAHMRAYVLKPVVVAPTPTPAPENTGVVLSAGGSRGGGGGGGSVITTTTGGQVLGATTALSNADQILLIKAQLRVLILQLIQILQAQLILQRGY